MMNFSLGVNIDHVATLRNSRNTKYPDPVYAAFIVEQAGADLVTIHLREDRRHINDHDIYIMRKTIQTAMNLEMAITDEMIDIACNIKPDFCCLVPEKRREITTENGLMVTENLEKINKAVMILQKSDIQVSLFINPDYKQIDASYEVGVKHVEFHTGLFAKAYESKNCTLIKLQLEQIIKAISYAKSKNLEVSVGHGLNYQNILPIAKISEIWGFNIGHSIIGRALFVGLHKAVSDMKEMIRKIKS